MPFSLPRPLGRHQQSIAPCCTLNAFIRTPSQSHIMVPTAAVRLSRQISIRPWRYTSALASKTISFVSLPPATVSAWPAAVACPRFVPPVIAQRPPCDEMATSTSGAAKSSTPVQNSHGVRIQQLNCLLILSRACLGKRPYSHGRRKKIDR